MKKLIAIAAFLLSSHGLAAVCPAVTPDNPEPQGWSTVAMSELNLPGQFVSARYITNFGVMQGLVFCDYNDQNGLPFYLMSDDYYADPNPRENKNSPWLPKYYPFKHHLCTESVDACKF